MKNTENEQSMDRKITHDELFTGCRSDLAPVAQTVEQRIENPRVIGSTPIRSTNKWGFEMSITEPVVTG